MVQCMVYDALANQSGFDDSERRAAQSLRQRAHCQERLLYFSLPLIRLLALLHCLRLDPKLHKITGLNGSLMP